jgi:hypothetical protein
MINNQKYLNFLSWSGSIVCLTSYGLNTQQILSSNSLIFLLMNASGCICLMYYTFRKAAYPNVALNMIYFVITMIAVSKVLLGWK